MSVYAHSLPGRPESEWQTLEEHSRNVAELAKSMGLMPVFTK